MAVRMTSSMTRSRCRWLCEDQKEVDRYWDALTANGGRPVQCGWLKDKSAALTDVRKHFFELLSDEEGKRPSRQ